MTRNNWNTVLYEDQHDFVWQYGSDVVQLLNPQSGEYILDLGCGTGQLTASIADICTQVVGMDSSAQMISKAKQNYPHIKNIEFKVADGRDFQVEQPMDAVFSNASLHWITQAEAVVKSVYQALKSNGRFVAEFGGKGNIESIVSSLRIALVEMGLDINLSRDFVNGNSHGWYFPSISEYTTLLEKNGFEVTYAELRDRFTPLNDGDNGLRNWIKMFGGRFLERLTKDEQDRVISNVEDRLHPKLYKNGVWNADYRRIRFVAIKSKGEY